MLKRLCLALLIASSPVFADISVEGTNSNVDDGGSYTPAAGSDRVVLWSIAADGSSDGAVTAATYDGDSMTSDFIETNLGGTDRTIGLFRDMEAGLPAGSATLDATFSAAISDNDGATLTLAGVDQTTPVHDSASLSAGGGAAPHVFSVDVVEGGIAVFASVNALAVATPSGYTEVLNLSSSGVRTVVAYKLITADGTETVTITESTIIAGGLVSYAPASSGPSFTSGPTISAATNGYTISGTLSGSGTLTAYAVACHPSASDASAAQIKAADCAGDVDAEISANEVWTTDVGDSFALTVAGAYPRYKVCVVGSDGTSDTSVTCSTTNRSADSGQAIQTLTSVATTSIFDDDAYFDPDVAANDVVEYDTATDIGCTIAFEADGDFTVSIDGGQAGCDTAGELDDRQNFDYNIQDVSASSDFTSGPPNWSVGDDTVWINNSAPQCDVFDPDPLILDEDETITSIDLDDFVTDADGDQPTYTVTSGTLPTGLTLTGSTGVLSFSYSVEDEAGDAIVFTATDVAGDSCTLSADIYVVDTWTMPDITGDTVVAAESTIIAAAPWRVDNLSINVTFSCHESVASGDIISQSPTASSEVDDANGAISATVSTGLCPLGKRTKGVTLPGVSIGQ